MVKEEKFLMAHNKRQNKKTVKEIYNGSQETEKQEPLTSAQVYDVLAFAENAYRVAYGVDAKFSSFSDFSGAYTPQLTNERLTEIAGNPRNLSSEQLQALLKDPAANQNKLIGYSEFLKFTDAVVKRTLGYLGNLPSFDYTFTCTNINSPEEYSSKEYLEDLQTVKDFLSKFDVRGQFAYINRRTFETDAFYSVFRMDGGRYEFQELPYDYCLLTGKNLEWGFQFDFDLSWFLKMGLSLDQYPPIFKKMYDNVMTTKYGDKYDPSNPLKKRKGTFSLWSQTSSLPNKGNFACFKMNSDIYTSIPFMSPAFMDAINKPLIRSLQNDQYIIAAQKIMIGLIPLLKDQKSGQIKDALAVSPETMGKFLGLLKQGLSNAIKITGAPFEDVKQVEFDTPTTSMYQQASTSLAASSGVTSRLIYSTDRMSATEVVYSAEIDEMISNSVYPQYEKWLSSQINFFTKKYKFSFKFEGTKYSENRKRRLENALKLADKGIVMPDKIAASLGMDIFEMKAHIEQSKYDNFQDLLYLLPNSNTKDYGTSSNGRPKVDIPSDSTERSDDYTGGE